MLFVTSLAAFLTLQNVSFNLVVRFVKSGRVTRVTNQWFCVKNFKREISASNDVKARH